MPPVPSEGEDFSTPLRSASVEMTEGAGRLFYHLGREISPLRFAPVEMTGMGANTTLLHNPRRQPRPPFFIICARRAPPQPSARRAVKPKNPPAKGRSNFRTFRAHKAQNLLNPHAQRACPIVIHNPQPRRGCRPLSEANTTRRLWRPQPSGPGAPSIWAAKGGPLLKEAKLCPISIPSVSS